MPNNQSVQNIMDNVQDNHKNYLEKTMKTQLNLTTSVTKESEEKIKLLMMQLETSYPEFTAQIAPVFEGLSMGAKVKNGVLSAGVGLSAGAVVNYVLNSVLPIPDFIPGKNLTVNAVSIAVGSVVAKAFYDVWSGGQQSKPAMDSEAFKKQLEESGFLKLSKDLTDKFIRLFHYRESLLFGKQPNMPIDMRANFKEANTDEFRTAVETHFLTELDKEFRNTFKEIYEIHNEKIQDDKNSYTITRAIRRYFDHVDPETFTQKLQVGFLQEVSKFLGNQANEPTVLAQYPMLFASAMGLAAGALALTIAPVSLGLVAATFMGVFAYYLPSYFDSLTFQRSQENRQALQKITDAIDREAVTLRMHTQQVLETSNKDITDLQHYAMNQGDGPLYSAYILVGSSKSWLEEYAARYRHSKRIETDLGKDAIKPIVTAAQNKVDRSIEALTKNINDNAFETCIEQTQAYLENRDNHAFIERFHVKTKIRDQLLEIVSALPKNKPLPQYVTDFYVKTLGGVLHDLVQVREITAQNELKVAAANLNVSFGRVSDKDQAFILKGDNSLRHLLDLPAGDNEAKLDKDNIKQYLTQSMHFMFSLLKKPEINLNANNPLNQVITYTDEFSIYHTLLLKQLASLIDPNNDKLDGDTKAAINLFLKEKLSIDPKDLLNQAFTDALLVGNKPTLDNMGELMRSTIACSKLNYTPKALLKAEVRDQINNHLFALHDEEVNFIPEAAEKYLQKLQQTISSTTEFVEKIKQNPILVATGACGVYLYEVQQEIIKTLESINAYIKANPDQAQIEQLKTAQTLLANYKKVVNKELGSQKMSYTNSQYYQLIDQLIAGVEAYEKSQHGSVSSYWDDKNKIKIAKAILENLQKLTVSAISDNLEGAIFKLDKPTKQDPKDLADLETRLNTVEFGQLKKIAVDYSAYMSELNNHQDAIVVKGEVFYPAEEDDDNHSDNDSVYEDFDDEVEKGYDIIFKDPIEGSQYGKNQS